MVLRGGFDHIFRIGNNVCAVIVAVALGQINNWKQWIIMIDLQ